MLSDDGFGFIDDPVGVGVGDGAGEAGLFQTVPEPLCFKGAGAGDLHSGIADVGNFFQRFRKVVQGLGEIPDGKELCADFHK